MAATHVVKATVMDIPISTQNVTEVPVAATVTEAQQGEEVDLSHMDPARVQQLEEAGAIETISAKQEREQAAAPEQAANPEHHNRRNG